MPVQVDRSRPIADTTIFGGAESRHERRIGAQGRGVTHEEFLATPNASGAL